MGAMGRFHQTNPVGPRQSPRFQHLLVALLLLAQLIHPAVGVERKRSTTAQPPAATQTPPPAPVAPDPVTLEKQLQQLNWDQFRRVVENIPRIKADVDKYGPLGWQYVKLNYRNYPWQKQLVKLDDSQRIKLAKLIAEAKQSGM